MKTSIIIPCYNEEKTIEKIVDKILDLKNIDLEIIIIDDNSTDSSRNIIENKLKNKINKLILNDKNYGKGYSIRKGIEAATGEVLIIQDADLEYDPNDYQKILEPFKLGVADVVYGSRFLGGTGYVRLHYYLHFIANKILTHFCNIFTNLNMTDMETGFKVFKSEAIKSINLN